MADGPKAPIGNKPDKTNWVEEAGGLPPYIKRIAEHLKGQGKGDSHAIASAVNTVKRWAAGGTVRENGGPLVTKATQTKAAAALAEWEGKKAASHALSADPDPDEVSDEYVLILSEERARLGLDRLTGEPLDTFTSRCFTSQGSASDSREMMLGAKRVIHFDWDAKDHPRDILGQFKKILGAAPGGTRVELPGGTHVDVSDKGGRHYEYAVDPDENDAEYTAESTFRSAGEAAEVALDNDALLDHPDSLGGKNIMSYSQLDEIGKAVPEDKDIEDWQGANKPLKPGDTVRHMDSPDDETSASYVHKVNEDGTINLVAPDAEGIGATHVKGANRADLRPAKSKHSNDVSRKVDDLDEIEAAKADSIQDFDSNPDPAAVRNALERARNGDTVVIDDPEGDEPWIVAKHAQGYDIIGPTGRAHATDIGLDEVMKDEMLAIGGGEDEWFDEDDIDHMTDLMGGSEDEPLIDHENGSVEMYGPEGVITFRKVENAQQQIQWQVESPYGKSSFHRDLDEAWQDVVKKSEGQIEPGVMEDGSTAPGFEVGNVDRDKVLAALTQIDSEAAPEGRDEGAEVYLPEFDATVMVEDGENGQYLVTVEGPEGDLEAEVQPAEFDEYVNRIKEFLDEGEPQEFSKAGRQEMEVEGEEAELAAFASAGDQMLDVIEEAVEDPTADGYVKSAIEAYHAADADNIDAMQDAVIGLAEVVQDVVEDPTADGPAKDAMRAFFDLMDEDFEANWEDESSGAAALRDTSTKQLEAELQEVMSPEYEGSPEYKATVMEEAADRGLDVPDIGDDEAYDAAEADPDVADGTDPNSAENEAKHGDDEINTLEDLSEHMERFGGEGMGQAVLTPQGEPLGQEGGSYVGWADLPSGDRQEAKEHIQSLVDEGELSQEIADQAMDGLVGGDLDTEDAFISSVSAGLKNIDSDVTFDAQSGDSIEAVFPAQDEDGWELLATIDKDTDEGVFVRAEPGDESVEGIDIEADSTEEAMAAIKAIWEAINSASTTWEREEALVKLREQYGTA